MHHIMSTVQEHLNRKNPKNSTEAGQKVFEFKNDDQAEAADQQSQILISDIQNKYFTNDFLGHL